MRLLICILILVLLSGCVSENINPTPTKRTASGKVIGFSNSYRTGLKLNNGNTYYIADSDKGLKDTSDLMPFMGKHITVGYPVSTSNVYDGIKFEKWTIIDVR